MIFLSVCVCLVLSLLFCLVTWQNPMKYIKKIRAIQWHGLLAKFKKVLLRLLSRWASFLVRPFLQLYYTARDPETSFFDKFLIYLCVIYMIWPFDFIPQLFYRLLGLTDDVAILVFVLHHTKKHIPPSANSKTEQTLSRWFGRQFYVVA